MAETTEKLYDPKPKADVPASDNAPPERKATPPKKSAADKPADPPLELSTGVTVDASVAAEPQGDESLEDAVARIRQLRKPFGAAMAQKLALPPRIGYHRHWFNDVAGRIEEAKGSGWAHLKNPRDGTPLKRAVGSGRDNNVLWAYAMELPEVFWQEEMAARHDQAKAKIDAIKAKPFQSKPGQAQASDQGKFYSPTEGAEPIQVVKG